MPFTPAHAAAAVPLLWLLGSRGVFSALVIGSMTPDFAYFLPVGVRRSLSHGLALIGLGLAWRLGAPRALGWARAVMDKGPR